MPIHPKFAAAVRAMAAKNADKAVIADIINNQLLANFGIDTPRKIAHFLSQCGSQEDSALVSKI
jgi:predicted chitinase